jgi:predicted nucleic acid-binding protein
VSVFVDTSALYALLDADDADHVSVRQAFEGLRDVELRTHAYVVVESLALVSRRLGRVAADDLIDRLLPVIEVEPVDAALHSLALTAVRDAGSPGISFVDRTSLAYMRLRAIEAAFTFDADFARPGFEVVPQAR